MANTYKMMQNDAVHLPGASLTAGLIYGLTLQEWVVVLWAVYVLCLIVVKLPDVVESVHRISVCVKGRYERWRTRNDTPG